MLRSSMSLSTMCRPQMRRSFVRFFLAPPIPKHPEHEADGNAHRNQPKCLLMNFNCHGGNSPFRSSGRTAAFMQAGQRASCIQMTPFFVRNE